VTRHDCLILLRAIAAVPEDPSIVGAFERDLMQGLARAGADMLARDLEPTKDEPRALDGPDLYTTILNGACDNINAADKLTTEQLEQLARNITAHVEEAQRA
jgi:hypothetical protein